MPSAKVVVRLVALVTARRIDYIRRMSRIRKAYETRFRWLLQSVQARKLDQGVEWLIGKAQRLGAAESIAFSEALTRVYEELTDRPSFTTPTEYQVQIVFFVMPASED